MRAFDLACEQPWAMTQDALANLLRIAARKDLDPAAVAAQLGRPLQNTQVTEERGGIAIIPVIGPVFRYANLFTEVSGATSLGVLARDFNAALANPAVQSILFNIDSPGGQANGVAEFAAMIYAARGTKPLIAYVGGTAASAAYWIASACDAIVCDTTALLGSIGAVAAVPNPHSGEDAEDITFVSSQSPNKRADPTTKDGAAEIQRTIDALAGEFIDAVALYRGVSAKTVIQDFGHGGVSMGRAAVKVGLADRLGSFESVVAELLGQPTATPGKRGGKTMAEEIKGEVMTVELVADTTEFETKLAALEARIKDADAARELAEQKALGLSANVAVLTAESRRKRFKEEVLGLSNDGIRWLGATDDNVETLETLADVLGEDSPKFATFMERERSRAIQFRTATDSPLKEAGSSQPAPTNGTALARLEAETANLRQRQPGLTREAAQAQIIQSNAQLRDDILAETAKGAN